jgi:hypothetical protein
VACGHVLCGEPGSLQSSMPRPSLTVTLSHAVVLSPFPSVTIASNAFAITHTLAYPPPETEPSPRSPARVARAVEYWRGTTRDGRALCGFRRGLGSNGGNKPKKYDREHERDKPDDKGELGTNFLHPKRAIKVIGPSVSVPRRGSLVGCGAEDTVAMENEE